MADLISEQSGVITRANLKNASCFFLPRLPGEKGTVSESRSQVSFRRTFVLDMRQAIWLYTKVL